MGRFLDRLKTTKQQQLDLALNLLHEEMEANAETRREIRQFLYEARAAEVHMMERVGKVEDRINGNLDRSDLAAQIQKIKRAIGL